MDNEDSLLSTWKSLEEQLRCEICRAFLDAPMALKCCHVFCSFCIRKFLEFQKSGNCPSCKSPACSSDLKPEPRLAAILNILRKNGYRKKLRSALTFSFPENQFGRNAVFAKQDLLNAHFAKGGTLLGRETMPMYKGMGLNNLRSLFLKENLKYEPNWNLEELVRHHKEFFFQIQAVMDGFKMQIFSHTPTREGVQNYWASEMSKMYGNLNFSKNEGANDPRTVDMFLTAKSATAAALLNFQQMREEVLRKRKHEET